jgi:hypothetical protein
MAWIRLELGGRVREERLDICIGGLLRVHLQAALQLRPVDLALHPGEGRDEAVHRVRLEVVGQLSQVRQRRHVP